MVDIIYRSEKGSPLTNDEVDGNFAALDAGLTVVNNAAATADGKAVAAQGTADAAKAITDELSPLPTAVSGKFALKVVSNGAYTWEQLSDPPPTNLTITYNPDYVFVNSSTGADAVLAGATADSAGAMSSADKTKLNGIVKQTSPSDNTAGSVLLTRAHNLGVGSFAKNKIINGKMEIAQRGGSFPAASGYTLDAWVYAAATAAIVTISKGFVGGEFQSCLQATVTTPDAIISAADVAAMQHRIEGYNITDLIGATFTLSFFVKSSKTGIHCCSLKNSAPNKSYVAEYTILEANVWEYKTITIVGGLPVDGTWNYTNGVGLRVLFAIVCGATYQTTPDAWQSGDFNATTNQVNVLDTVGNIFAITGVQLEVGSVATPFEHRPYGQELALCQRYYHTAVFYVTVNTAPVQTFYPVPMRAPPTIVGGGAGFSVTAGLSAEKRIICSQTTPSDQTLTFSAEL